VVTAICPGSTRTPIIKNIRVRGFDRRKLEKVVFPIANRYSASKTADIIVDAVQRDRRLVVTTALMKTMVCIKRISPALYRSMVGPFARFFHAKFR
jgi:short-subunit dehydrogenase